MIDTYLFQLAIDIGQELREQNKFLKSVVCQSRNICFVSDDF